MASHPFFSSTTIPTPVPCRACKKSAAFSAIMIVGLLVLPLVMRGMDDASATVSASRPRTLKNGSNTAPGSPSFPMRHVQQGWKMVVAIRAAASASAASEASRGYAVRVGRCSRGLKGARARESSTMRRVSRMASAATFWSAAVAR